MSDWTAQCHKAADHFQRGEHDAALAIFLELVKRDDVGQADKAFMWCNVARVFEAMKRLDEAHSAYSSATRQALQLYFYVEQVRIASLIEHARYDDAIDALECLLESEALSDDGRAAAENNLRVARDRAAAG